MLTVLRNSWALLFGMMLLMLGNGMQGTLLGIRGGIEGFTTTQMSYVMAAYFAGFLFGSRMTPEMIRRVGHVRVFAALGSMISAVLIMYAAAPDWMVWVAMRVIIGFPSRAFTSPPKAGSTTPRRTRPGARRCRST